MFFVKIAACRLCSGLLASTILVLFVVPALFSVCADLRMTSAEKIREETESGPPAQSQPQKRA